MKHGTVAAHGTGCRCLSCRCAYAEYQRRWMADSRRGRKRMIPIGHSGAPEHIDALLAAGHSYRSIAAACNLSDQGIHYVHEGRSRYVRRETAAAILGVRLDTRAGNTMRPSDDARRMVAVMRSCGYTLGDIGAMLGRKSKPQFSTRITARKHHRIVTLYRLLVRAGKVPPMLSIEEVAS